MSRERLDELVRVFSPSDEGSNSAGSVLEFEYDENEAECVTGLEIPGDAFRRPPVQFQFSFWFEGPLVLAETGHRLARTAAYFSEFISARRDGGGIGTLTVEPEIEGFSVGVRAWHLDYVGGELNYLNRLSDDPRHAAAWFVRDLRRYVEEGIVGTELSLSEIKTDLLKADLEDLRRLN